MSTIDFRRYELQLIPEGKNTEIFTSPSKAGTIVPALAFIDESSDEYYNFRLSAFDKDDMESILIDMGKGISPLHRSNLIRILDSYISFSDAVNNTIFDTTVTKCGNSLVLKVTEQCRMMQLNVGDNVRIKMERINTYESNDNIEKLFYRKRTSKIIPYEFYADGEKSTVYFEKFLNDYNVVGKVSLRGIVFDIRDRIMDHYNAVRTKDGNVILISIPYDDCADEECAKAFADAHNLEYDYISDYSWYHRGQTQLVIFWLKGTDLKVNRS